MSKLTTGHKEKIIQSIAKNVCLHIPKPKNSFLQLVICQCDVMSYLWSRLSLLGFTASATIHILRFTLQICFPLYNLHQSTHCFLLFSMVWTTMPPSPGRHWRPMSSRLSSKVTNCLPALYHRRLLPPFSKTIRKQAIFLFWHFYNSLKDVIKRSFYDQANRKGGKGGWRWAPSALTISKCENFDPFGHWDLILWYSKHISAHCGRSQNAFFTLFYA